MLYIKPFLYSFMKNNETLRNEHHFKVGIIYFLMISYLFFFFSILAKECGGVFTDPKRIFKSPGFPNEYDDNQICYWHIRLKYGQRIHLSFLEFDLEDDPACLADYVEIYDSYDDIHGFVGRYVLLPHTRVKGTVNILMFL